MKNHFFKFGFILISFSVFFTACDDTWDNIGDGINEGIEELACPTITTGYEHEQETRNAVFTPCSSTSGASKFELQMTINGTTFTYDEDATIDNIPRDAAIPLKVTHIGSTNEDMTGVKIRAKGAPLAGSEQYYQGCESDFMNEQSKSATDNTDYCKIELEETLGESLTEDRETILLINDIAGYHEIHIDIEYID